MGASACATPCIEALDVSAWRIAAEVRCSADILSILAKGEGHVSAPRLAEGSFMFLCGSEDFACAAVRRARTAFTDYRKGGRATLGIVDTQVNECRNWRPQSWQPCVRRCPLHCSATASTAVLSRPLADRLLANNAVQGQQDLLRLEHNRKGIGLPGFPLILEGLAPQAFVTSLSADELVLGVESNRGATAMYDVALGKVRAWT